MIVFISQNWYKNDRFDSIFNIKMIEFINFYTRKRIESIHFS